MRTKLVFQGEIAHLFIEQNRSLPPPQMAGYSVSIVMDELPVLIYRALKNKSRQSKDGAIIVEVTREVIGRAP